MFNSFINTYIDHGWVMWTVLGITAALSFLVLPFGFPYRIKREETVKRTYTWYTAVSYQITWAVLCAVLGWFLVWLLSDVFVVFGVGLGRKVFIRISVGCAAVGYACISTRMHYGWRKVISIVLIPVALLMCTLQVNAAYGQYPTIRAVLGIERFSPAKSFPEATVTLDEYREQVESHEITVPKHGKIASFKIPATKSHFKARSAVIYLPPAALTKSVPTLPVLIVLSGQPGDPDTFFTAGQMGTIADEYASKHNGIAPVIISPDQLGNKFHNTMCADTLPYGKTETYLTQDVVSWMEKTLPISTDHSQWALAGFSQGGTCSVELGPAYPQLFGHVIDVAGESSPNAGSVDTMINRFYGGNKAAYEAHIPANAFKKYAPSNQTIIFGAGQLDTIGQADIKEVYKSARSAGWAIQSVLATSSGHDWTTVQAVMKYGLADFCYQTGLGEKPQLSNYSVLKTIPGMQNITNKATASVENKK